MDIPIFTNFSESPRDWCIQPLHLEPRKNRNLNLCEVPLSKICFCVFASFTYQKSVFEILQGLPSSWVMEGACSRDPPPLPSNSHQMSRTCGGTSSLQHDDYSMMSTTGSMTAPMNTTQSRLPMRYARRQGISSARSMHQATALSGLLPLLQMQDLTSRTICALRGLGLLQHCLWHIDLAARTRTTEDLNIFREPDRFLKDQFAPI